MDLKTSTWCTHSVISHSRWEGCELVSLLPQNLVLLSLSKRTNPCIILRFKPELVPTGFYQLWFLDKECPRILRSWQMIPSLAMINFVALANSWSGSWAASSSQRRMVTLTWSCEARRPPPGAISTSFWPFDQIAFTICLRFWLMK